MKKFFLVLSLGIAIGVATAFASAKIFSDVPSNAWYAGAVQSLSEKGIISGYSDDTYRPKNYVNRAELAMMIDNLLKYLKANPPSSTNPAPTPMTWTPTSTVSFGRAGGNIKPYTITISGDGSMDAYYDVSPQQKILCTKAETVLSDKDLTAMMTRFGVDAFDTMVSGVAPKLPDFAHNFISLTTPQSEKTVTGSGDSNPAFSDLYDYLLGLATTAGCNP